MELEQKMKDFRQEQLNNKRFKGFDKQVNDLLIAYSKGKKRQDVSAYRSTAAGVGSAPAKAGRSAVHTSKKSRKI